MHKSWQIEKSIFGLWSTKMSVLPQLLHKFLAFRSKLMTTYFRRCGAFRRWFCIPNQDLLSVPQSEKLQLAKEAIIGATKINWGNDEVGKCLMNVTILLFKHLKLTGTFNHVSRQEITNAGAQTKSIIGCDVKQIVAWLFWAHRTLTGSTNCFRMEMIHYQH